MIVMRGGAPHHPDVFSHLPALLMRELETPEVAAVLVELVAAGWRPGQLRHRVGAGLIAAGSIIAGADDRPATSGTVSRPA